MSKNAIWMCSIQCGRCKVYIYQKLVSANLRTHVELTWHALKHIISFLRCGVIASRARLIKNDYSLSFSDSGRCQAAKTRKLAMLVSSKDLNAAGLGLADVLAT